MEICVKKISLISIFSHLFMGFSHDFVIYIDLVNLPMPQLQTQHAMTSQIRSHKEYLIQTYITFFC